MCFSISFIWFSESMIIRRVSVELTRDLFWFGIGASSMIWIGVSSNLKIPICGSWVVNGCGDIFGFRFVRVLKIVDLPVFGNPARTHCMSAFLIPCCFPLPDFFCLDRFVFSFFNLVVRLRSRFSEDLCFGASFIIISKHVILSSSVVALWNSCSALW